MPIEKTEFVGLLYSLKNEQEIKSEPERSGEKINRTSELFEKQNKIQNNGQNRSSEIETTKFEKRKNRLPVARRLKQLPD